MSITITDGQVITGGALSGATSPTFTVKVDQPADVNQKQYYVSALGGTYSPALTFGAHSAEVPFICKFSRPKAVKTTLVKNASGQVVSVPKNTYRFVVKKGGQVDPLVGVKSECIASMDISVPVGFMTNSPGEVTAFLSFLNGVLTNQLAGIKDALTTGSI